MQQLEIVVEAVNAHCVYGYEPGQVIPLNGYDTPTGFCGGAYTALFPVIVALLSGAQFGYEQDPDCKTGMACPDRGKVIFSVRRKS